MSVLAGIKFTKDAKKNNRYVTIDLKKHSKVIMPVLIKMGAINEDDFDASVKNGDSLKEVKAHVHKTIDRLFKNKK
jgi:hypothetical protein